MTITKEHFSGCIIGQCLGDASGFPVEGHPPDTCRAYVDEVLRQDTTIIRGRGLFSFGQYTDDSQLARELMISYADTGAFDPADYATRIAAIFQNHRIVGHGRATKEAAARLIRGVNWVDAGTPSPSAGNGSAMRAGPVGLFFYDNPDLLIQAAHDQGRITHQDRRCSAGAVAIAGAVALSVTGGPVESDYFLSRLSGWAGRIDPDFGSHLRMLKNWVVLPPDEAVRHISRAGIAEDYSDQWAGISPFVVSSVLWSLYAFLRSPDDFSETICTAIAVGGDVDTTAAMAGAVSGAYLGLTALPLDRACLLTDQGEWGYDALLQLAHRCHDIKSK